MCINSGLGNPYRGFQESNTSKEITSTDLHEETSKITDTTEITTAKKNVAISLLIEEVMAQQTKLDQTIRDTYNRLTEANLKNLKKQIHDLLLNYNTKTKTATSFGGGIAFLGTGAVGLAGLDPTGVFSTTVQQLTSNLAPATSEWGRTKEEALRLPLQETKEQLKVIMQTFQRFEDSEKQSLQQKLQIAKEILSNLHNTIATILRQQL